MGRTGKNIYGGRDPRELPAYGIPEAAHYLRIPVATLRTWVCGRHYPTQQGLRRFKPIIALADTERFLLSFVNLIEAHVLAAIRRHHRVSFPKVRSALRYLNQHFPSSHPLADQHFETNGLDLFVEQFGNLIAISDEGQLSMRDMLKAHLHRIERDVSGLAIKLYLFTRRDVSETAPRVIVVDPRIAFGRPVVVGTRISTEVVYQRFEAGESIARLADDYGRTPAEIEEALRCEHYRDAA